MVTYLSPDDVRQFVMDKPSDYYRVCSRFDYFVVSKIRLLWLVSGCTVTDYVAVETYCDGSTYLLR